MTLKVVDPIDVTEAVLTASDIPEPDAATGEQEWQGKEQRQFEIGPVSIPLILIDSVYVKDYGLYTLSGNKANGYQLTRFNDNGDYIASVLVPKISDASGTDSANVSLSFDEVNNTLMVGRTVYSYGEVWDFDFVSVRLDFLAQVELRIDIDFGYKDYKAYSEFKSKTDGLKVVFLAVNKDDPYGDELSRELAIFSLKDMKKISSTNDTFSDFCISDGEIYCLAEDPSINFGQPVGNVTVFDDSFKIKRKIEFKWPYSDQLFGAKINGANSLVTYSIENSDQLTLAQIYDKNMINIGAYRRGDEVIKSSTHRKYRCVTDVTFEDPEVGVKLPIPTWIDIGPTNKWAMFDEKTTTSTIDGTSFSMTFNPVNYVNAMAFFNVAGTESINITVKDAGGTERYNEDFALLDISPIYDYYTYFFYQNTSNDELVADDLPPYYDPEITVTFTGNAISVGAMVMGFANQIGTALTDTQTDTLDYSRQEYDEFGELTYIERPVVNLNTYEVLADKTINPYIQNLIKKLRGKNTLWIGDIGGGQKLITYGRYERSPIPFTMPNDVRYSITVRGSI